MSSLLKRSLFALIGATLLPAAHAYTPESGWWWNPAEPGSGLQLEVQDNFIAISGYVYDDDGFPLWFVSTGFLDGNASFTGDIVTLAGGTCLGCAYTGYPDQVDTTSYGQLHVVFDPNDNTRADLTWRGRTVPIQRHQFYLHRGEDGSQPIEATKMLGEWQAVLDLTDLPGNSNGYGFFADILRFDSTSYSNDIDAWLFEGCRSDDSLGNTCQELQSGLPYNDAAGVFDDATGRTFIVVTDSRDNNNQPANCVLFDIQTGTNEFRGGLDYQHDGSSGGVSLYPCGSNPDDYGFYPVRGWRSASRTFVQDGYGPSKQAATPATTHHSLGITPTRIDKRQADPARDRLLARWLPVLEARLGVAGKE